MTTLAERAAAIVDAEARAVAALRGPLSGPDFAALIEALASCRGRIWVTGVGKSGLIGARIAASLRSVGADAAVLNPVDAMHGDLGGVRAGDVALALSRSGETRELLSLLPELRRIGVPVQAITCRSGSALAAAADGRLELGDVQELPGLAGFPTISTTLFQVVGDAIVALVFERLERSEADLRRLHPAGFLGRLLGVTVGEAMRAGDAVPTIHQGASLQAALLSIIEGRLGVTCALDDDGALVGVITDGDVKRILIRHGRVEGLSVREVMTRGPQTIAPGATLQAALERMEGNAGGPITCLIVVDGAAPVGVLHIHHVLGAQAP